MAGFVRPEDRPGSNRLSKLKNELTTAYMFKRSIRRVKHKGITYYDGPIREANRRIEDLKQEIEQEKRGNNNAD